MYRYSVGFYLVEFAYLLLSDAKRREDLNILWRIEQRVQLNWYIIH